MIPDQIVSSVQNSRRTIIILSKVTENTVVVTSFKGTVHRYILYSRSPCLFHQSTLSGLFIYRTNNFLIKCMHPVSPRYSLWNLPKASFCIGI